MLSKKKQVKLKVLHWKKVPLIKTKSTVFEGLARAPPKLLDRSPLEKLFADEPKVSAIKSEKAKATSSKISLLDLRRAQVVGIMLSRFKISLDAVARAVQRMDARVLTYDDVMALKAYIPTEEEAAMINEYDGDLGLLAAPEQYFRHVSRIPLLAERLDAFSFLLAFDGKVRAIKAALAVITSACEELIDSAEFRTMLSIVLGIGNMLNEGTFAGGAVGFKLEILLRLHEVKSGDGKSNLLNYIIETLYQEHPELLELPSKLSHAEKACKESFLELEKEVEYTAQGMKSLDELMISADQDHVLYEVIAAFQSRTKTVPGNLQQSLQNAKDLFDEAAKNLVEERTDNSPGDLFKMVFGFCQKITKVRERILKEESEAKAREERRAAAAAREKQMQEQKKSKRKLGGGLSKTSILASLGKKVTVTKNPEEEKGKQVEESGGELMNALKSLKPASALRYKVSDKIENTDKADGEADDGGSESQGSTAQGQMNREDHRSGLSGEGLTAEVLQVLEMHSKVAHHLVKEELQGGTAGSPASPPASSPRLSGHQPQASGEPEPGLQTTSPLDNTDPSTSPRDGTDRVAAPSAHLPGSRQDMKPTWTDGGIQIDGRIELSASGMPSHEAKQAGQEIKTPKVGLSAGPASLPAHLSRPGSGAHSGSETEGWSSGTEAIELASSASEEEMMTEEDSGNCESLAPFSR